MLKFNRSCTRYINGNCRLTGYTCGINRQQKEPKIFAEMREIVCYWFTRDPKEGERVFEKVI